MLGLHAWRSTFSIRILPFPPFERAVEDRFVQSLTKVSLTDTVLTRLSLPATFRHLAKGPYEAIDRADVAQLELHLIRHFQSSFLSSASLERQQRKGQIDWIARGTYSKALSMFKRKEVGGRGEW